MRISRVEARKGDIRYIQIATDTRILHLRIRGNNWFYPQCGAQIRDSFTCACAFALKSLLRRCTLFRPLFQHFTALLFYPQERSPLRPTCLAGPALLSVDWLPVP